MQEELKGLIEFTKEQELFVKYLGFDEDRNEKANQPSFLEYFVILGIKGKNKEHKIKISTLIALARAAVLI